MIAQIGTMAWNTFREAVRDHLATSSHDPRVVRIEAEYLVVVATA